MKISTRQLTRAALVCALYVVLTYISAEFGLSSGVIQFRISEALCIMPLFLPESVFALTLGCFISNLLFGGMFLDMLLGSFATFMGALGARAFYKAPYGIKWMATLPTVISNTLVIPPVLMLAYGVEKGFLALALPVLIGEAVCAGLLGSMLYYMLSRGRFDLIIKK